MIEPSLNKVQIRCWVVCLPLPSTIPSFFTIPFTHSHHTNIAVSDGGAMQCDAVRIRHCKHELFVDLLTHHHRKQ